MASCSYSSESPIIKESSQLRKKFLTHNEKISHCLNYEALIPFLCEDNAIFTVQEALDLFAHKETRMELICEKLEQDYRLYETFLDCVRRESTHLGNEYVTSLLERREYATTEEETQCTLFEAAIKKKVTEFTQGVNLSELIPLMTQNQLLTESESAELCDSQQPYNIRVLTLIGLLDSKGPFGYSRFVDCLGQEHAHCTHPSSMKLYMMN